MHRLAFLALLPASVALAQPPDVADILNRSIPANKANGDKSAFYAYREHTVFVELNNDGREDSHRTETWDVIGLEGSTYRKLIERDNKALPAKEQKREDERLVKETEKRRKETPEQRQNRLLSFSYGLSFSPAMMHLYDSVYLGEEGVDGRLAYVVQGMPKAAAKPANSNEKELLHYRVKRWIDKEDLVDSRVELEVTSEGSRMKPGSLVDWRSLRTNDGVWLEQETRFRFNVKFFKMIGARGEMRSTRSNYQKFEVNSRIVEEPQ